MEDDIYWEVARKLATGMEAMESQFGSIETIVAGLQQKYPDPNVFTATFAMLWERSELMRAAVDCGASVEDAFKLGMPEAFPPESISKDV